MGKRTKRRAGKCENHQRYKRRVAAGAPSIPSKRRKDATLTMIRTTACATGGTATTKDSNRPPSVASVGSVGSVWESVEPVWESQRRSRRIANGRRPYSLGEYKKLLNDSGAEDGIEEIEMEASFRAPNSALNGSGGQQRAQYGRILAEATEIVFDVLELDAKEDVFVDVGHGIGNTVNQAAYTRGCRSRGIEVAQPRFDVSLRYAQSLERARNHSKSSTFYRVSWGL